MEFLGYMIGLTLFNFSRAGQMPSCPCLWARMVSIMLLELYLELRRHYSSCWSHRSGISEASRSIIYAVIAWVIAFVKMPAFSVSSVRWTRRLLIVCLSALVSMLAQKQCFGSLKMAVKLRTTYAIFSRFRSTADIVTSCRLLSNHTSMFLK